eukprot:3152910-Amphidinium_carterae.1
MEHPPPLRPSRQCHLASHRLPPQPPSCTRNHLDGACPSHPPRPYPLMGRKLHCDTPSSSQTSSGFSS